MPAIHGRKIERGSVGTPGEIAFSAVRFGHSASGRVIRGASNHDFAVGNHRDRFPIRVERCLGDPSRDVEVLFCIKRVFGRRDDHRSRDRIWIVKVKCKERVPSMQNDFSTIGSRIESRNVDVLKIGDRLSIPAIQRLSMNVLSRVRAIREEEDGIITRPSRLPVVSCPIGQRRERVGGAVIHPDVAPIVAPIVPPLPLRVPSFESRPGAIGAPDVQSTEGIVQSTRLAAFDRNLVGTRGSIEITLEIPRESHDNFSI